MYIKGKTIQKVWPRMVKKVMKEGQEVLDERGSKTKELLNVVWTVTNPEALEIPKECVFKKPMMDKYKNQFLNPDLEGFVYQYGHRFRTYFGIDQVNNSIKRLKECKNSRRATMVTLDPKEDALKEDIPCCIVVDFKIRNDKLYTTAVFRSNDLFGASVPNFFALYELSKYVSKKINIDIAEITVQSISMHIYEVNWQEAKKLC